MKQLMLITHFSEADINKFKTFFLYTKELDLPDFVNVLKSFAQKHWVAIADRLFYVFDRRSKERLNFDDFMLGFSMFVNGTVRDRASICFDIFAYGGYEFLQKMKMGGSKTFEGKKTEDKVVSREHIRPVLTAITMESNLVAMLKQAREKDAKVHTSV